MKVLVTGAGGFLGRHVVGSLHGRGHHVRAMVRTAASADYERLGGVEVVRADLRRERELREAVAGVDAVVHLAAALSGDEDAQFAVTVGGTERLLAAMAAAEVRRLVLASSIAVYDWARAVDVLSEESPTLEDVGALDRRGGYAVAKVWQERVARRAARSDGTELTVLRPGFIWAAGHEPLAGVGQSLGSLHLVIGPRRPLPITYVENCADCFAHATERRAAIGRTFNVIDDEPITAWRFMAEYLRRSRAHGRRIPVPYALAWRTTRLAGTASRAAFGEGGKLPSILTSAHFEARFRPLRFSTERLRAELGWRAPLSFREAIERTYSALA